MIPSSSALLLHVLPIMDSSPVTWAAALPPLLPGSSCPWPLPLSSPFGDCSLPSSSRSMSPGQAPTPHPRAAAAASSATCSGSPHPPPQQLRLHGSQRTGLESKLSAHVPTLPPTLQQQLSLALWLGSTLPGQLLLLQPHRMVDSSPGPSVSCARSPSGTFLLVLQTQHRWPLLREGLSGLACRVLWPFSSPHPPRATCALAWTVPLATPCACLAPPGATSISSSEQVLSCRP